MFEQPAAKSENDRSRTIMALSGLAILAVIVLIIIVTSFARRPTQTEFAQAGSPEFDAYVSNVLINNVEKKTGELVIGSKYAAILCTVRNAGDRVLVGLQLRATVIGTGGQLIREKIITPVPNSRDKLDPNQAMKIDVSLERVPDPTEIRDITIEVHGLKLK
jgi:hypothetical protein